MPSAAEPDFSAVEKAMRDAGLISEPAEIHGELCGLFCVMGADAGPAWAAQVMAQKTADTETAGDGVRAELDELSRSTWQALDSGNMGLRLLLPGDDDPLDKRAEQLGLWCQGFMHGLGAAGNPAADNPLLTNEVTSEIIADFSEISRAVFGTNETQTEGEAAYMELVEYVRVSVQLTFEELHRMRKPADSRPQH